MALTKICVATSFEPATTSALPLAAINSFAAIVIAFAATLLFKVLPGRLEPDTALYKAIRAGPSSDGLIGILTSAFEPVRLIPVSNWIWRDIFLLSSDLLFLFETYWRGSTYPDSRGGPGID